LLVDTWMDHLVGYAPKDLADALRQTLARQEL
jgi:hypothetical protein